MWQYSKTAEKEHDTEPTNLCDSTVKQQRKNMSGRSDLHIAREESIFEVIAFTVVSNVLSEQTPRMQSKEISLQQLQINKLFPSN